MDDDPQHIRERWQALEDILEGRIDVQINPETAEDADEWERLLAELRRKKGGDWVDRHMKFLWAQFDYMRNL